MTLFRRKRSGEAWETVEDSNGGSLPDPSDSEVGAFLRVVAAASAVTQPTLTQVDAAIGVDPALGTGLRLVTSWTAEYDYGAALNTTDGTQFIHPAGNSNIFATEATGGPLSGSVEPVWDDAPNVGDSLSDGDLTWYNVGPAASFPPTPTTWVAETEYATSAMVWPTTPNGHVYVWLATGTAYISGTEEPEWPTDGSYAEGDSGYLWDAGYVPALAAAWQFLTSLAFVSGSSTGTYGATLAQLVDGLKSINITQSQPQIQLGDQERSTTVTVSASGISVNYDVDEGDPLDVNGPRGRVVLGGDAVGEGTLTVVPVADHDAVKIYNSSSAVKFRIDDDGVLYAILPTSDPGGGAMWNDGGTVKVGT